MTHFRTRMRRRQSVIMIGSLLYYALYPLARYVTRRHSEASEKALPPAELTPPDRGLTPSGGTKGETEERMKEPSPEKEEQQLVAVLHEETRNGATSTMSEPDCSSTEGEAETVNGLQQDRGDSPEQKVRETTIHQEVTQNTEEGIISPTGNIVPEKALEDTESMTPAEAASEVTECWDEYVSPTANDVPGVESRFKQLYSCLPSDAPSCLKLGVQPETQASWHFPAGPGLAEEVRCPLWDFPAVSYYPPMEPTVPFEVMWRVWEDVSESAPSAEPLPFTTASMDFTVMSYNVLAQDLLEANPELYTHCPLEALDWSCRCSLLLEELHKWAPDILCLQEVQENHYRDQLHPALSLMGYACVFKRRSGTKTDGCATCYRRSRFSELSVATLEFYKPEVELLDRHNVAVVLLLRPAVTQGAVVKAKGRPLCVANTHLLFNPRRGDVKLAQLAMLMAEIDRLVKSCKAKGEDCNLISGQEDLSHSAHSHRLYAPLWPSALGITDGCQHSTAKEMWKSQTPGSYRYGHDFMQRLRFCPAARVRPVDLERIPGVTHDSPAGDFKSVGLKLLGSLSLLSEDVLWSMRGLPNHIFPSDHLSLLAKFQLDLNAA
ncbi:Protein angel 1 [Liparis tanakae]|uniref:Protein angel 1 n=1 Tax=Liparis tanakae TaxID=230148 RepID=A0A4Z2GHC7_9TELE|nr:Protein angel 1 [Liparis tanakae]